MYDPKDLLKLYLYGYMNRIRSSRRLEAESNRNLEVIWLLGKLSPDHKTIAEFRRRNGELLKNVFKGFVKLCVRLGLYGRELVAIDGSKFKAVNSKDRNYTEAKLWERIQRLEVKIEAYLAKLDAADREETEAEGEKSAEEIRSIVKGLEERKERHQAYEEELKESGERQKSLTDPDSRLTSKKIPALSIAIEKILDIGFWINKTQDKIGMHLHGLSLVGVCRKNI